MNRRKAIGRIILAGVGGVLAFGGYKWYEVAKHPDLPWLERQQELLAALADTIVPPTNTPGASQACLSASSFSGQERTAPRLLRLHRRFDHQEIVERGIIMAIETGTRTDAQIQADVLAELKWESRRFRCCSGFAGTPSREGPLLAGVCERLERH